MKRNRNKKDEKNKKKERVVSMVTLKGRKDGNKRQRMKEIK